MLIQGRTKLVEKYGGERYKLLARDGNEIDTVVVDRRGKDYSDGDMLVICCEGNAGFYEYGITGTPLEAGFSVLGWNHPGFAGSTGIPFPENEANAIDVVMQFSINKLGFKPENIVIYAWSIGGYAATWGAMNYPDIRGLILDATFDDLLPLAISRMPPSWKPLVVRTIRDYMNLNNGEQLCKYSGPVLLVRRSQDEMISTKDTMPLQTNRGNNLLIKLLQCRYPKLVTDETAWVLTDWLAGDSAHQTELWNQQGVEEDLCLATLKSYAEENYPFFPMHIGEGMPLSTKIQLILFLAQKHMIDFDSTHCPPLPPELFQLPWKLDYDKNNPSHDNIYIVNKL
ncbi:protein ABHD16A-like [Centruroides sculpturatus]|uniref:protein ABHD16A-like n=1 Tax=Centruroides sculpturatus TaxID=218467 RepID=UPI000C6D5033|nr:protein ABHD16A-like [Centruroides sculpturatus]